MCTTIYSTLRTIQSTACTTTGTTSDWAEPIRLRKSVRKWATSIYLICICWFSPTPSVCILYHILYHILYRILYCILYHMLYRILYCILYRILYHRVFWGGGDFEGVTQSDATVSAFSWPLEVITALWTWCPIKAEACLMHGCSTPWRYSPPYGLHARQWSWYKVDHDSTIIMIICSGLW